MGECLEMPVVESRDKGSFDCVPLSPHFAQDDTEFWNGGSERPRRLSCNGPKPRNRPRFRLQPVDFTANENRIWRGLEHIWIGVVESSTAM